MIIFLEKSVNPTWINTKKTILNTVMKKALCNQIKKKEKISQLKKQQQYLELTPL